MLHMFFCTGVVYCLRHSSQDHLCWVQDKSKTEASQVETESKEVRVQMKETIKTETEKKKNPLQDHLLTFS